MKTSMMVGIVLMSVLPMLAQVVADAPKVPAALVHVTNRFSLVVNAPLRDAFPLFGPEGERVWAGKHWDPKFVFPQPSKDVQGAVFTLLHGTQKVVWVNTLFDVDAGRIQYVYFIPDALVTTIDLHLEAASVTTTNVEVTYTRTALSEEANEHVQALGQNDRDSGKDWEGSINAYLKARGR